MKRHAVGVLAILVAGCGLALAQGAFTVSTAGPPPSDVPAAIAGALLPQGTKVLNGQDTLCQMWWSKLVPTQAASGASPDVLHGNLAVGTFLGVVQFPKQTTDFRGQSIKPGFYTMRYALVPTDGNHMGVSTYRDFVLLSPLAADTDTTKTLSLDDLLKLSRQASGTGHPAVMSVAPASPSGTPFPGVFQDDSGHTVLEIHLTGKGANGEANQDFPFALIVVGQYQG